MVRRAQRKVKTHYRILVVDDDEAMRLVLRQSLTREGHVVTLARNGVDAQRVLDGAEVDLVITDLVMPEVEGLQLIRSLRREPVPPKVIAISGGGRGSANSYLELAEVLGAAATLAKPFASQALNDTIDRVMRSDPCPDASGAERR